MIYPRNKEKRLRGQEAAPHSHRTAELKLQPRSQMNPPECVGLVVGVGAGEVTLVPCQNDSKPCGPPHPRREPSPPALCLSACPEARAEILGFGESEVQRHLTNGWVSPHPVYEPRVAPS